MGMFSGLLDDIRITAASPDGNLECELEDGRNVVMGFAAGSYRRYTEPELARQVAALLTSLWAGQRRAHVAVLGERSGCQVRGDGSRIDRRSGEFTDARDRLRTEGRSTGGRITVTTTGLRTWQVHVTPDTVRRLDEEAFLNEVWSAVLAVMTDYRRKLAELRRQVFDAPPQR